MHTPQSSIAAQPPKPQHPEKARCPTAQLQPPRIKQALHYKPSPPSRWRDLRLCSQRSTGLQMLSIPTTQPCNVTTSSASWLFSPKVSQPTAEVCIYHTKRGIKRKGLSSGPQTGKDRVASAAIYCLRFIKLSLVPNFKTPPNQGSYPQHCFIFKLGQMHWTVLHSTPYNFRQLQHARCG